jgi:hypothetical protein
MRLNLGQEQRSQSKLRKPQPPKNYQVVEPDFKKDELVTDDLPHYSSEAIEYKHVYGLDKIEQKEGAWEKYEALKLKLNDKNINYYEDDSSMLMYCEAEIKALENFKVI